MGRPHVLFPLEEPSSTHAIPKRDTELQPRGAKRRERTRADLLAAARRVFAVHGYHEATITEITEVADVGVGTFYLHFRDKDALFNTLLDEGLTTIREQVTQKLQLQGHPSLPAAIRLIFQQAYEQRELFRIAVMGDVMARRFQARELLVSMAMRFLEHAPDLTPFSTDDIPLLAQLLSGTILQAITWWFEQDTPGPDLMTERVLHVLQHGFPASSFVEQQQPLFPPETQK